MQKACRDCNKTGKNITQHLGGLLATYTYFRIAYKVIKPDVYKIKTVMVKK